MQAVQLIGEKEKEMVSDFFHECVGRLRPDDRTLPQLVGRTTQYALPTTYCSLLSTYCSLQTVTTTTPLPTMQVRVHALLRCGIGVHHSGLLPLVREMTEMLFARGFVQATGRE